MSIRLRLLLIRRHPYPPFCLWERCLPPRRHQRRRYPFCRCECTDLSRDHVTIVRWGILGRVEFDISDSGEATEAFIESTTGKSELFRYNPGKEQRIFSDKHPYYSKRGIRHCAINSDELAANLDKNEECEVLRNLSQKGKDDRQKWEDRHKEVKKVVDTLCGEDKKRTINQSVLVAPMPTNVIEYCRNKGCPLTETDGRVDIYMSVRIESYTQ